MFGLPLMGSISRHFPAIRLGLRSKLMLLTSLVMLFVVSMIVILVSRNMRSVIQDETLKRSLAIGKSFGANNLEALRSYNGFRVRQNASNAKSDNELAYVVVYNKEGLRVADTEDPHVLDPLPSDPEIQSLLAQSSVVSREIDFTSSTAESSEKVLDTFVPITAEDSPRPWATVRIGIPTAPIGRSLRETQLHILQIGLISLLIGLLGAAFLGARITTPIIQLKEGSLRAASGDLSSIIQVQSGDELEALAQNFNYMMAQIKQHQEERIRAEKLAAVGYMVNTVVHDCRTPIAVIKGFASVIQEFETSPAQQRECLDFIQFEVDRMERMLDEILQYAVERKISLVFREEPLDDFVKECCTEIKVLLKTTQIQLSSDLCCHDLLVRVDRDKLRRAILNLAANAREALKGEGEIRVRTESIASQAVIHVEDTGSGIPEELQQKIFEPFFTHGKSLKGFGLGMSITQRIVADHAGRIELHSELGKGTTFSIWLPLATANPRASAAAC
jgi:signal transduction histidine kinase